MQGIDPSSDGVVARPDGLARRAAAGLDQAGEADDPIEAVLWPVVERAIGPAHRASPRHPMQSSEPLLKRLKLTGLCGHPLMNSTSRDCSWRVSRT